MKKIAILKLKPTQMAIGFLEVQAKAKKLRRLNGKKLKAEINENPVDVIVNPKGSFYIIDGHHRVFAYWLIGIKKIPIKVKFRFPTGTTYNSFWKKMSKEHWVHPYNESGDGPIDFLYLAKDIRGVGNDPYRGLAWLVREMGGYKRTDVTFADFAWAQFFRKKRLMHCKFNPSYKKSAKKGLELAKSTYAKHLPGYDPDK